MARKKAVNNTAAPRKRTAKSSDEKRLDARRTDFDAIPAHMRQGRTRPGSLNK